MRILTNLSINIEILAGTTITEACEELCLLAGRLCTPVSANFNGVTLLVNAHDSASKLEDSYNRELNSTHKHKFATA